MTKRLFRMSCLAALVAAPAAAQTLTVDPVACLPREANATLNATVAPEISNSDSLRLHFRRLHPTGGYYWVEMQPVGGGAYWGVFPKPEDRDQRELTDEWWEILKDRDWMRSEDRDREWLEEYLDSREHEAAEYFVSVVDSEGDERTRSATLLVEVQDRDNCVVGLTRNEFGRTQTLIVGETLEVQEGREVFHWLCDGIVSRVNFKQVLRPDELCRACVVAGLFPTATAAGAVVAATAINRREPRRVSAVTPEND